MNRVLCLGMGLLLVVVVAGCSILLTRPEMRSKQQRWEDLKLDQLPLKKPVTIYWNEQKVPFINAQSDKDLAFTLGYVHGYLRHYQLQMIRMISMGRLSELGGPWTTDIDKTLRILNFEKAVPQIIKNMPKETRIWSESFLAGLNHAFALKIPKPADAEALKVPNEQWTLTDLVRFWRMASIDINWMVYAKFIGLKQNVGWEKFYQDMVKVNGDASLVANNSSQGHLFKALNYFHRSGSNSFAISGRKTKSKGAVLANDPHLGIGLPPAWLLLGMKSPSYQAAGFMIPGIPFIAVGRNPHVSWGGTNMRGMSSFLYEVSQEDLKETQIKKESFKVRWWSDDEMKVRISKYGPILTDSPLSESQKPLALYWVGHEPSDEITAFLKANRAKNWKEFRKAFETYAVSAQNILYADDQGNIGHLLAYKKPIRKNEQFTGLIHQKDNPVVGFKKPTELPAKFNPKEGFLASANNRPEGFEKVGLFFSTHDRILRLKQELGKMDKISREDINRLQNDVFSYGSVKLRNLFVAEAKKIGFTPEAKYQKIWEEIVQWPGTYESSSRGALAFETFAIRMAQFYFGDRYPNETIAKAALRETHWKTLLSLHHSESGFGSEYKTRVEESLETALDFYQEYKTYGQFRYTPVAHILANIPYVGSRYLFEEIPAHGNADTLHKRASNQKLDRSKVFYGQNSRHISFMNDINENYFVLFGGNDGYLNNPHMTDMVQLFKKDQLIRIPLDIDEVTKYFKTKVTHLMPKSSGGGMIRSTK